MLICSKLTPPSLRFRCGVWALPQPRRNP
jgi:hypothetical protein